MVGTVGVEPTPRERHGSKPCAYTSSATYPRDKMINNIFYCIRIDYTEDSFICLETSSIWLINEVTPFNQC